MEQGFWLHLSFFGYFFHEMDDSVALTSSVHHVWFQKGWDIQIGRLKTQIDRIQRGRGKAHEGPERRGTDREGRKGARAWWMWDRRGRCWHFKPISLVEWIPLSGWAVMDFFFLFLFAVDFLERPNIVSQEFEQQQVNRLVKVTALYSWKMCQCPKLK